MVNVDAAFDPMSGGGSMGVITRCCGGDFVAVSNNFTSYVTLAHRAEAYAMKDGMLLAQQIGASRLIIVSDSSMVVETMENGDFSSIAAAVIYDECYALWRDLVDVSIKHCQNDVDRVAHELARRVF